MLEIADRGFELDERTFAVQLRDKINFERRCRNNVFSFWSTATSIEGRNGNTVSAS